jgi:hypothetical protein
MNIDEEEVDKVVLALLYLTSFQEGEIKRSWKSYDWSVMDHLHEKGYISDPKNKNKSVVFSELGEEQGKLLVSKYFTKAG